MLRRIVNEFQRFTLLLSVLLAVHHCGSRTTIDPTGDTVRPQILNFVKPGLPAASLLPVSRAPTVTDTIDEEPVFEIRTVDLQSAPIIMNLKPSGVAPVSASTAGDSRLRDTSPDRVSGEIATSDVPHNRKAAGDTDAAGYIDQYLQDGQLDDVWQVDNVHDSSGLRQVETEFVRYQSSADFFGREIEQGVRARWRRETLNWGEIDLRMVASDHESDFLGTRSTGSDLVFTMRQSSLPVSENWVLNNALGSQRTRVDSFLHGGYRIRLPTSTLIGFSSEFTNDSGMVRWTGGRLGHYRGVSLQQFEKDGGKLFGALYRQDLATNVAIGAEIINIRDAEFVHDHTSLLLAGRYGDDGTGMQHDLHVLVDDNATFGIWGDSKQMLPENLILRYGAFYLEPQLAWMDRPIATDQSGFYLRTDKQSFLYNFSLGYDYTKSGIGSDFQSSGVRLSSTGHAVYLNGNYRPARRLSLGISGNVLMRRFDSTESHRRLLWRLNNFLSYRFDRGTGRLEIYANDASSRLQTGADTRVGARLSYDWSMRQGLRLTTEVALEEQDRFGNSTGTRQASVLVTHNLFERFSWGFNTGLYRTDSNVSGSSTGISFNADGRWQFLPNWHATLSVVHSDITAAAAVTDVFGTEQDLRSDSLWLTVGYSKSSGLPYQPLGSLSGAIGSGRIHGQVFYDENHDSIRQPGERAGVGLVVLLDGRDEARTDSQGRYSFNPVGTGRHHVTLLTEDLPLPWGLFDETPRDVIIRLRQISDADFALIRVQ